MIISERDIIDNIVSLHDADWAEEASEEYIKLCNKKNV